MIGKILKIIGLFVVIFLPLIGFGMMMSDDYRVNHSYVQTECHVVAGKLIQSKDGFKPVLVVTNIVDKIPYNSTQPIKRLQPNVDKQTGEQLLSHYPPNSMITCWYDPTRPNMIALEKGYHLHEIYLMLLGATFLLILFIFSSLNKQKLIDKSHITRTNSSDFEIRVNRFTTDLIYFGEAPVTPAMLPAKYKMLPERGRKKIANFINTNGKFTALRKPYAYCCTFIMLILAILVWVL